MAPRIVWRYRRKRPTSATRNRKKDRGFSNIESQAAGSPPMQVMQVMEQQEVRPMIQFVGEEEIQARIQLQEEEEEMAQPQFQEEEEEEMQPQFQEEEEEEVQAQFQETEEEEEEAQMKREPLQTRSSRLIRSVAKSGFNGNPGSYPFRHRIQAAFGSHDISRVKAFSDANAKQANSRLGALAYASREKVAFRGYADLHTAAHEAAHIIQQRQGVQLKDGTGRKGDPYERHADAVADRVVQGKSVQSLLSRTLASDGNGSSAVQLKETSTGHATYATRGWALEVCGKREKEDLRPIGKKDPQGFGSHEAQQSAFAETDPKGRKNRKIISFDAGSLDDQSKPMDKATMDTEVTGDIWDVRAVRTVLFDEEPRFDDIIQSGVNSCYLLAVLLSLTNSDKGLAIIREIVSETPDAFVVKFYQVLEGGIPDKFRNYHVTVPRMRASWQAMVPIRGPYPITNDVQDWLQKYFPIPPYTILIGDYYKQVAWVWAIEKAFATVVGDWESVEGGDAGTAFLVLLGRMGNAAVPKEADNLVAERFFPQVINKFQKGVPMTVAPRESHEIPSSFTHSYHLVDADESGVVIAPQCEIPTKPKWVDWDNYLFVTGKTFAKSPQTGTVRPLGNTESDIHNAWKAGHIIYGSWWPSVNFDGRRFFLSQHAYSITGIDAKTISLEEPFGRFPLHKISRKQFCGLFSIIYASSSF